MTDVVAIAAGRDHYLALRADGTVTAWGRDQAGKCHVPEDLERAVAIAAGIQHSLALLADGTAAELRAQAGAGADTHLDQVFRSLVQASDPAAAAKAILG